MARSTSSARISEIGLRDLCLHEEPCTLQQRLARLRVEPGGIACPGELAEEVHLVAEVRARRAEVTHGTGHAVEDAVHACDLGADGDLRRAVGVRDAGDGTGLREPRGGDLNRRVAAIGAVDQGIELGVGERLPPLAAGGSGGGLRDRPVHVGFLERGRRDGQLGRVDLRNRGAAGDHESGDQGKQSHINLQERMPRRRRGISPWRLSARFPLTARKRT